MWCDRLDEAWNVASLPLPDTAPPHTYLRNARLTSTAPLFPAKELPNKEGQWEINLGEEGRKADIFKLKVTFGLKAKSNSNADTDA